ncbi:MarR family winged helix-turn-helix transcriptional regulator [Dyadobacter subterraneus]|uniref:MarR family transcriptional regulator n=1 Tax=Dyadobacter subterraneus TaxID=2773304 RepID=A0ABR9WAG1_9BACT|nr:MarR family transcriptional regulator [Dyadobacter subterraneus]MBE9461361.1 MarR family transcriptional regulator [Dyadobacter subterraneus]
MTIEEEIRQAQFNSVQQKAGMNLIFTANWLSNLYTSALKPLDLSLQQLNVLTILKGQPNHMAPVNLIRDRLIDRMPNVSRLLNKLMEKELIQKDRTLSDQRVVHIKLTPLGLETAEKGGELFQSVAYVLSDHQAEELNGLLNEMRK